MLGAVESGARSFTDVVELTGLARPTAHRLIQGLEDHGFLVHVGGLGYVLGPRLLGTRRQRDARSPAPGSGASRPRASRSVDRRERSTLRSGRRPAGLHRRRRVRERAPHDRRGRLLAAPDEGLGRARCSSRGPETTTARVSSGRRTDPARLERQVATTRRRGWAESVAERAPGVASVSAPVFGPDGALARRGVGLRAGVAARATQSEAIRARRRRGREGDRARPRRLATRRTPRAPAPPGPGKISSSLRRTSSSSWTSSARNEPSSCSSVLGPDDGGRHRRLVQEPRERDVRRPRAQVGADLLVALQPVAVLVDLVLQVFGGAATLVDLLERSRQQAARERAPGDQAHPVLLDRGDHLELERALGQVVEGLLGGEARPCATCWRSRSPSRCASRRSSTIRRRGSCPRSSAGPSPPRSRSTTRSGRCGASGRGRCSRSAGACSEPSHARRIASFDRRDSFGQSAICP